MRGKRPSRTPGFTHRVCPLEQGMTWAMSSPSLAAPRLESAPAPAAAGEGGGGSADAAGADGDGGGGGGLAGGKEWDPAKLLRTMLQQVDVHK